MKRRLLKRLVPMHVCVIALLFIAALLGSEVISVFHDNKAINTSRTIIIDAGHGGVDGGATSCTGVPESQLNLQIAKRMNDLLHLLGISTYMIRTEDISVYTEGSTIAAKKVSDLKNRVKMSNGVSNGILISIHQNHFGDSRYSGAQIFYAKTNESRLLAESIQSTLIKALDKDSNRRIKKADGVYLMERVNCTGVLVECGFLSNPEEEKKLRDSSYQKKLCCVISSVISRHLNVNPIA